MDINSFINIIAETIKDDSVRADIYNSMLEAASTTDISNIELGIDSVFDHAYEEYIEVDKNDDDIEETDEDDYNYDYEEEE